MNKKKESLTPLKSIISRILKDSKLPFNPDDAGIWREWDNAVGPAVGKHAQPVWIKEGRLRVRVSDPIWLQELRFSENTIKNKINERLGRTAVKEIEFRLFFR